MVRNLILAAGLAAAFGFAAAPASALTMQECSAKYQAAKTANKLGGKSWNDFRKAECQDDDADDNAAAAAVKEEPKPAPKAGATPASTASTAAPKASATRAVFPRVVDKKYASEKPGQARLKTCADQYNANKAKNANGELRWIQAGGGYWSECNKKLKEAGA
jgi:hypothetical protein